MNPLETLNSSSFAIFLLFAWSMFWKGISLWRASKESQRNWFVAILIINTIGVLELVYLFKFCNRKLTLEELKGWLKFK